MGLEGQLKHYDMLSIFFEAMAHFPCSPSTQLQVFIQFANFERGFDSGFWLLESPIFGFTNSNKTTQARNTKTSLENYFLVIGLFVNPSNLPFCRDEVKIKPSLKMLGLQTKSKE